MVAAKSSRVNRQYKKKYRIRNWREYERGLRNRGDVTIWLSEDAIAAWVPPKNGLRGGQRRYSNLAVRTALTLRVVFSLPLRQTEGFLDSLLRLMGLNLKAPVCYPPHIMSNDRQAMRRRCPRPRLPRPTAVGLSRRESLWLLVGGFLSAVVSIVTDIKTWFTPPPPQRQAVELSGGTHHRVDAGSVEFLFAVSQPTVTVVRAKAPVARWV